MPKITSHAELKKILGKEKKSLKKRKLWRFNPEGHVSYLHADQAKFIVSEYKKENMSPLKLFAKSPKYFTDLSQEGEMEGTVDILDSLVSEAKNVFLAHPEIKRLYKKQKGGT